LKLLQERANLSAEGNDEEEDDLDSHSALDVEHSIGLCLQRLVVLSKRWDIADLLGDDASEEANDQEMNTLCIALVKHLVRELQARQLVHTEGAEGDDEDVEAQVPEIYLKGDQEIHAYVAETVKEGVTLLLSVTAWRLNKEIELIDNDEAVTTGDMSDHTVVQMRDRLLKVIHYCFEQHVEPAEDDEEDVYSPEHRAFAKAIQEQACAVAGDIRGLFPKKWCQADSSFLRACALAEDDEILLGGFARFLATSDPKVRRVFTHVLFDDDSVLSRIALNIFVSVF